VRPADTTYDDAGGIATAGGMTAPARHRQDRAPGVTAAREAYVPRPTTEGPDGALPAWRSEELRSAGRPAIIANKENP